ncbi:MAG: Mrp/NBP35 family ATP-binding protein [Bacillota bacterium]
MSEDKEYKQLEDFRVKTHELNDIKHVIGIVSGKGGVGKSMVTASLAVLLSRMGYKVGILDADITGPSIPRMFGITEKATGSELGIFPARTKNGMLIISSNMLLENPDDPVIWRGPLIGNMAKQFWTDVVWGNLDYLLVDLPPGTGDVPLTIFQAIPLNGVVIVSSPQSLVQMIVKKAHKMAHQMKVPVIGLVENMSYLECDCGKRIELFGPSKIDQIGYENFTPVLAKMPINPALAALADQGEFENMQADYLQDAANIIVSKYSPNKEKNANINSDHH